MCSISVIYKNEQHVLYYFTSFDKIELKCSKNNLISLPVLLRLISLLKLDSSPKSRLRYLDCKDNQLIEIPKLSRTIIVCIT